MGPIRHTEGVLDMKSIIKLAIFVAATLMLVNTVALAGAQLASLAYGYPSIFQNGETTTFSKDLVSSTDLESVNIDFGAAGLSGLYAGFPTISQTSEETYYAEHMDYAQTTETAAFNYPYLSVGEDGGLSMLSMLSGFGI
jgi:hypothetical protein